MPALTYPSDFDFLGLPPIMADMEALAELASTKHDPSAVVIPEMLEVGSWAGASAFALLQGARQFCKLFCVDDWQGTQHAGDFTSELIATHGSAKVFETFCRNLSRWLMTQATPLRGGSDLWAGVWPQDFPLDLIFIDADHRYEHVAADIKRWLPHVRKGGIICGHDYGSTSHPGVQQAVDELLPQRKVAGETIWWTRKE